MANEQKTYKIRKGAAKYSYIVSLPNEIVKFLGFGAEIKFKFPESVKEGEPKVIQMICTTEGQPYEIPPKLKPGPKK